MASFDRDACVKGLVPWCADEYADVMQWWDGTVSTPKHIADIKKSILTLGGEAGSVTDPLLSLFAPMEQLCFHVATRYGADVMPYHMYRLVLIMDFLLEHLPHLRRDAMVSESAEKFGGVRREIIEALCVVPFSKVEESEGGGERRRFDYDEVVAKARELMGRGGLCG